jgi:hypothetical protein
MCTHTCSPKAAKLLLRVLSGLVSLPVMMPVTCSINLRNSVLPHLSMTSYAHVVTGHVVASASRTAVTICNAMQNVCLLTLDSLQVHSVQQERQCQPKIMTYPKSQSDGILSCGKLAQCTANSHVWGPDNGIQAQ